MLTRTQRGGFAREFRHGSTVRAASFVLALAACTADTSGLSGGDDAADTNAAESETAADSSTSTGSADEGSGEQNDEGDGDPSCDIGAEGCPCTPGDGCDPGLSCDLGVCAPATGPGDGDGDPTTGDGDGDPTTGDGDGDSTTGDGDGDPTTGDGDGDPTTGDGDGDRDPSLMCLLDNECSEADQDGCVCEGCNTNGFCGQGEDCVCPDCTNESYCKGDACVDTGNCHPYFEGCGCADCAAHPQCR